MRNAGKPGDYVCYVCCQVLSLNAIYQEAFTLGDASEHVFALPVMGHLVIVFFQPGAMNANVRGIVAVLFDELHLVAVDKSFAARMRFMAIEPVIGKK